MEKFSVGRRRIPCGWIEHVSNLFPKLQDSESVVFWTNILQVNLWEPNLQICLLETHPYMQYACFLWGFFCILYHINQVILQVFLCYFIFLPVVSSILLRNFFIFSAIDYIWAVSSYLDPDYLWSWAFSYVYKLLCSMKSVVVVCPFFCWLVDFTCFRV